MKNLDQLFIRACKSREPLVRVNSVYRRFYLSQGGEDENVIAICNVLIYLIDRHCRGSWHLLIEELGPSKDWMYPPDLTYHARVLRIVISRIRLSHVKVFDGCRHPAVFRNADRPAPMDAELPLIEL